MPAGPPEKRYAYNQRQAAQRINNRLPDGNPESSGQKQNKAEAAHDSDMSKR